MGQKVTISTVAKEVGMSIAAVSRAFDQNSRLRPEKRELILETAKKLGYTPNKMAARLHSEPIHIGVLILGAIEEYYEEYVRGIKESHQKFASYKVELDLRILKKHGHSQLEAYEIIYSFIEGNYDGVILSGFDNSHDISCINRLAEENIPFILLDHDISGCRRSSVSMNDVDTAGRLAAQLLSAAMCFANKNVAIICSDLSNMAQKKLVDSFCSASETYNFKVTDVLQSQNDYETAYQLTRKLIEKDIGGIYISTANSIAVCKAIEEAELAGKISLIASDVFDELGKHIKNRTVFATVYQDPIKQARDAFDSICFNILEKKDIPEYIFALPIAVFESNWSLYLR